MKIRTAFKVVYNENEVNDFLFNKAKIKLNKFRRKYINSLNQKSLL